MAASSAPHPSELCSQCSIPIEFDEDEFLVDMCVACDRVRHRRLSAERRRSSDASEPCSPDSVMAAGFEGLSVEAKSAATGQTVEFAPPKTTFVFGAEPTAQRPPVPTQWQLRVSGLHPDVSAMQVRAKFSPFGELLQVTLMKDPTSKMMNYRLANMANIVYADPANAKEAQLQMHDFELSFPGVNYGYGFRISCKLVQEAETVKQPFSRGAWKPKRFRRPARAAPAPAAAGPAAAEAKATGAAAEAPTAEAANATETAAQQPAEAAAAPPPPPADATPREAAPSPAICSETNRQAAEEWLDKARKRHEAGDDAAALRFCEKSLRLHEGNEAAAQLAAHLRKFGAGTPMAEAAARVLKLGPREHAAVLQLSATQAASADAVRAAYRKLALLLHPDKNQARQAEAAFKRLQVAYEALSAQASGTGGGGGPSTRPSGGSSGGSSRGEYSDDECFCTRCGEYCEYGEELCEECAEEEERDRAFEAAYRRGRGASSHAYSSHTSRCYDCGRPYSPPASYCGSKPMCWDCRDGYESDDDYGRYGGYRYGFY